MLASEDFSLYESMSATVIMDEKMDPCYGISCSTFENFMASSYEKCGCTDETTATLLLQELIIREAAFLDGASLLESLNQGHIIFLCALLLFYFSMIQDVFVWCQWCAVVCCVCFRHDTVKEGDCDDFSLIFVICSYNYLLLCCYVALLLCYYCCTDRHTHVA